MRVLILIILLVAAPLAAQVPTIITVNDTTLVVIYDNDSTFIFVEQAPRDVEARDRDAAAARQMDAIAEHFSTCGCAQNGGGAITVLKWGGGALGLLLAISGVRKLGQIAKALEALNKEHPPHPKQETTTEPHKDSESGGENE